MQTSGEPDTRLESFRDVSMEFDADRKSVV